MAGTFLRGIDLTTLQRWGASALFIGCTFPVLFVLTYALERFPHEGSLHNGLHLLAQPQAPTLYAAYIVTTLSTLMGSVLLPSLKREDAGRTRILPAGLVVLSYTGFIAFAGIVFLFIVADPDNYRPFSNDMPAGGGAAQIKSYVSWAIGACLTVFSTLFGVPPPRVSGAPPQGG